MCIITVKKKGIDFPSREAIKNMFSNNKDGAGFMYAYNNDVYIVKGLMTLNSFDKAIGLLKKEHDLKDLAMVLHFRAATRGIKSKGNTHPFPVTNNVINLKKVNNKCRVGLAHNGTIKIKIKEKTISDTMQYILDVVNNLYKINNQFYKNKYALELLDKTANSKLAILSSDGTITTVGEYKEDNGLIYSNDSYKRKKSS